MAQKAYFTGSGRTESSTPAKGSKTAEHVAALRRVATSVIGTDYEMHAKTLHSIANHMAGASAGKAGVKEYKSNQTVAGQKKTNVSQGG